MSDVRSGETPLLSRHDLDRFAQGMTEDATRARASFTAILATVGELLGEADFDALLRKVIDQTIHTTGTERGILLLQRRDGLQVRLGRDRDGRDLGPDLVVSRRIPAMVLEQNRPVISRVSRDGEVLDLTGSVAAMRLRKVMCAPVRARGRVLGVLYVDSADRGPPFTPADLVLFHAQAGLLGMAIEHNRLLSETIDARTMNQQLAMARRIQQGLLPKTPIRYGRTVLTGRSRPSEKVGGDYFDAFALESGRLVFCIGEVAGVGIGPAIVMSNVRSTLRGLIQTRQTLTGLYGRMNRALCEDLTDGMFAALFVASYVPERKLIEYQNAGHTAPFVVNPSTGELRSIFANAPALGFLDEVSAGPCPTERVQPGEVLVCCTDGITDRHSPGGGLYGIERAHDVVRRTLGSTDDPEAVVSAIMDDCEAFAKGLPPHDDRTVLVVRF